MSAIPVLPVTPQGALDLATAMERCLPEEWARWASAREASDRFRKQASVPPGGRRWPETEPMRLVAIKRDREVIRRSLDDEQQVAWRNLVAALLCALQAGELQGYIVPASAGENYCLIPVAHWQQLSTILVRGNKLIGLPIGAIQVMLCPISATDGSAARSPGRPPAETRGLIEAELHRREEFGERLSGVHVEAAAVLKILRDKHPERKFPQEQTVAKWIREKLTQHK